MEDGVYTRIQTLIIEGNIADAQQILDGIEDKDAQWHYLSSHIYLAKNWTNESRKQLEIAIELDPENEKYKEELQALIERAENAQRKYDKSNKKKQFGKGFWDACPEACGEGCCMCCVEVGCTAICEGCGG
ncbi:MAG: hypothetical protein K2J54_05215 [Clostridia bacterium]|nr:hypothetical protein [Clostridia bacterium]MDE7084174.1 hypothetical protein [Clostridia bacterium]MDE7256509.1 hypothetical protein [Clostridia bacterium]